MKILKLYLLFAMLSVLYGCNDNDNNMANVKSLELVPIYIYYETHPLSSMNTDYIRLSSSENIFFYEGRTYAISEDIYHWFLEKEKGDCFEGLVSGQLLDSVFVVSDVRIIEKSNIPEAKKAIQGQWFLTNESGGFAGEAYHYTFSDSPFLISFHNDSMVNMSRLGDVPFRWWYETVSWSVMEAGDTRFLCFSFGRHEKRSYMLTNVNENMLNFSDLAFDGYSYTFKKIRPVSLNGTSWRLYAFCDISGEVRTVEEYNKNQLTLYFRETNCGGRTNVNSFFGEYFAEDSNMRILNHLMTEVCCEDENSEQYLKALKEVASFEVTSATLKLFYSDTEYLLFHSKEE